MANDTIKSLQEERTAQILGGNNPPTLLITTQFREENRVHLIGTEIVHDTTVYYVDIKFELKNDSKYFIKSVFATIDGLDYSNLALLNFRLRGEWRYQFKIDVEWTNGEYIAEPELWSNEAVELENLTRENVRSKKFKLKLNLIKQIKFKKGRGKKLPF